MSGTKEPIIAAPDAEVPARKHVRLAWVSAYAPTSRAATYRHPSRRSLPSGCAGPESGGPSHRARSAGPTAKWGGSAARSGFGGCPIPMRRSLST